MQDFLPIPAMKDAERAGTYTYYQCLNCNRAGWYHEEDAKVCRECGFTSLIEAPRAESKEESDKRSRELGLW